MKELSISNLAKTYGTKTLLDHIDLAIRTGERIGLIGPNGTGKSSLIRIIAGVDNYDEGTITKPNDYQIAYLSQNPALDPDKNILETLYQSASPITQMVLAYEKMRVALEQSPGDERLQSQFLQLSDRMTQMDAWDFEVQAKTILNKLGLSQLDRRLGDCSGGEQKRIGIAQALLSNADLLLLDEPTNHLDVDSIQWLESYLAQFRGALLVVTHDRYFLDRVANKIIELRHGNLTTYEGNYEKYLEKREQELLNQERVQQKQDRLYQQELAWMRAGAKARTTKQQARIDRFNRLEETIQSRNVDTSSIETPFEQQRIGNDIIEMEDVTITIGNQVVVRDYTKMFIKGDRLGIVGDNGVGKSTFLNAIAGLQPLESGILKIGQTVKMAYYRQLDQDLPADERILSYLTQVADQFKHGDGQTISAAQLLERFNFERHTHGMLIGQLSGGERRRLYLLTLLVQEPNVLLLDEPTNDLDIDTLTVLEDYLADFKGVVIIVSHDRYFLDKTCDQLLILSGSGNYDTYYGSYSEYLQTVDTPKEAPVATPKIKTDRVSAPSKKGRLSYHEKKEWETIEADIFNLEETIETIHQQMLENATDAYRLMDLQKELDTSEEQLLALYERYEYLSEKRSQED